MNKRWISLLLCVVMAATFAPAFAYADAPAGQDKGGDNVFLDKSSISDADFFGEYQWVEDENGNEVREWVEYTPDDYDFGTAHLSADWDVDVKSCVWEGDAICTVDDSSGWLVSLKPKKVGTSKLILTSDTNQKAEVDISISQDAFDRYRFERLFSSRDCLNYDSYLTGQKYNPDLDLDTYNDKCGFKSSALKLTPSDFEGTMTAQYQDTEYPVICNTTKFGSTLRVDGLPPIYKGDSFTLTFKPATGSSFSWSGVVTSREEWIIQVKRTKTYTWTGKKIKPKFTVKRELDDESFVPLTEGVDYTYHYDYEVNSSSVGNGWILLEPVGNDYVFDISDWDFQIIPKGTSLTGVTSTSTGVATIKWKSQSAKMSTSRINGYQVQLATNKKFNKNKKNVNVKGYKTTTAKASKLKAKTKYFVRIRTFKSVYGEKIYSKWSNVKTVKIK
nr:fibronectin type III domain-containing protein [Bacillota bacterium]